MGIMTRGKGGLSLYRRVPGRYAAVEPRKFVWVALGTDSPTFAKQKGEAVWAEMIEAWEAKLAGDTTDAEQRFEAARTLAKARGVRFLPLERVAQLPREELRDRMAGVTMQKDRPDLIEAAAVLGGAKEPPLTVTKALEAYWDLARERVLGMSPDQFRRWRNPRIKAVRNFVDVVGDKPIARITGDDMLDYRRWWLDRIEAGEVQPDSCNKNLVHLGDVLKTVNRLKRLGLVLPLADLAIRKGEKGTRLPFSDAWIRDRLLAPGAMDGLNVEARNVVTLMINTGLRLGEASNLQPGHIHLDGAVPYVEVAPTDARRLKTANARRKIPLIGCSLEAMRECPQEFPRYVDKPGLSATINKFLRENMLMESPAHTVYGLRHSFEDRLLAAGVDERIRRDLMGHTLTRERFNLYKAKLWRANIGSAVVAANNLAVGCDRDQEFSQDFVADLVITGHAFRRLKNVPDLSRVFGRMILFFRQETISNALG